VCARSRLRACARSHLRACARPFSCACALAHLCALARPLRGIFTCTYAPTDPRPRATRPARRPRLKAERLANATARARLLRTRLLFCYHILNLVAKLVSRFQLGKLLRAVTPPHLFYFNSGVSVYNKCLASKSLQLYNNLVLYIFTAVSAVPRQ